jgi:phosphoglycerol transferase MdoB-like AlkP superfamily enzyme
MRYFFVSLFKLLAFWMLFFALERAIFLIYYKHLIVADGISFNEMISVFFYALKLDFSTASYLVFIPFLLLLISFITAKKWPLKMTNIYTLIILIIYSLIASAELGLYAEWKTKLSYKALAYLKNPSEIFNSASTAEFSLLLFLWVFTFGIAFWGYLKLFSPERRAMSGLGLKPVFAAMISLPVLFFGARGGLSAIPVSTSSAYFSKHNILNLTAVNSLYNMGVNLLNTMSFDKENIFKTMPDADALAIVKKIHLVEKDTTVSILKISKPNIVIVLIESFSADLIESLGGEPGITPHFRELEKEGLLFTNFYANANRSQQAMGSIYAGLPGIPITTITNHPEKYAALPSFSKDLKEQGYFTGFYFGGQLNYGNILSYLIYNELDNIVEGKDLPSQMTRGKLGVHDGVLLPYYAEELSKHPEPFFSTVFTLSSHAPYDFPMEHSIHWPLLEKEFVNSAHYTDKALGAFFEKVKQESWFDNTLFLIMADHSKNTYRNHPLESFEYHKIPLLLYGPALKDSLMGSTFDLICGNTDITTTLLKQLGMSADAYFWSKDVFNPYYKPFAFFELNEGLGWKRNEGHFVWDKFADRYYQKQLPSEKEAEILLEGKAYLQVLFGEFLDY